jgi:hypothetical protein
VSGGLPGGGGGGAGQSTTNTALVKALRSDARRYRWVAAVSGSQSAASLELATGGEPVMAIGGFDNEGGNLTLAQFKQYVARGEIHYYIATNDGAGGPGTAGGGSGALAGGGRTSAPPTNGGRPPGGGAGQAGSSSITSWVKLHYKAATVGGQTVYDLTQARA